MSKRYLVAAALAAVALVASACGSGDRGGTSDTGVAANPTTSSAAAPVTGASTASTSAGASAQDKLNGNINCSAQKLQATETGVSANTITVTMMGDIGSTALPGLANSAVDAVKSWAKLVNSQGGLACRQIEVKIADSKLDPQQSSAGYTGACQSSLAVVGTTSLAVADMTPVSGCKDKAGATTGLPEYPGVALLSNQICNATTFPTSNASGQECPAKPGTQTITSPKVNANFIKSVAGANPHGVYVVAATSPTFTAVSIGAIRDMETNYGLKADAEIGARGNDTQSTYTPAATQMKQKGSTFLYDAASWSSFLLVQKEVAVQGGTPKLVYCQACNDPQYAKAAGKLATGVYVPLTYLPLTETSNAEVKTLTDNVKDLNSYGQGAWVEARLFQQAVADTVAKNGVNGLTRANLLAATKAIKNWTDFGMAGKTTPSAKAPAACAIFEQIQADGSFKRVMPTAPGTFTCSGYNKATLNPYTAFKG